MMSDGPLPPQAAPKPAPSPQPVTIQQSPAYIGALMEALTAQRDAALSASAQYAAQAKVFVGMLEQKDREIADLQAALAAHTTQAAASPL